MKSYALTVCTVALLTVGCHNERKPVLPASPGGATPVDAAPAPKAEVPRPAAEAPAPATTSVTAPADAITQRSAQDLPPDILVMVNDRVLKLDAAVKEVDIMTASARGSVPPQQMEQQRGRAFQAVVEQFVANSLLIDEADRLGITLTPEDEANAASNLLAMLPPGVTIEQAIRRSPLGEAQFRAEMLSAARIKKLLKIADTPETKASDADFAAFTNQYRAQIEASGSVRARHILVATKPADDTVEKDRKRQFAESLRTQLVAGADFAAMAKEYSDCPSKEVGGDLGRFGRGKMVKPFSDAAFQQPVNAIGDVVETKHGYHIIQVTARSVMSHSDLMEILRRQRLLDHLAKTAKIKFNRPPQQQPRRNSARPQRPMSGAPENASGGVTEVNPRGDSP